MNLQDETVFACDPVTLRDLRYRLNDLGDFVHVARKRRKVESAPLAFRVS
jgi:hypothetical protein